MNKDNLYRGGIESVGFLAQSCIRRYFARAKLNEVYRAQRNPTLLF